jgi:peptide/nickel transport system substrate-binding protein/oligopeptide transport system substrate-binding protein
LTPAGLSAANRLVYFLAVVVTAAGLGCAGDPDADNALQLALKTSPNQLDPALVVDVAEGEICAQLFQGLVRIGPDGTIVSDLAKSWEIEDGGVRYEFHLDRRMRFADGRAVDAGDVRFSFERVLSPGSRSSRRWVLDRIRGAQSFAAGDSPSIDGISTPDDSTVVIELDEPFGPFLSLLALPAAMVVPREALTAAPAGAGATDSGFRTFEGLPVGSGRWRLAEWERGDYLLLEPNPHHPVRPERLGGIRFRIIPEAFTRVAEFESGALDVLEIPPAELDRFREDDRYRERIQQRSELRVYYIGLNNTLPPFDDPRVRRALNMAVDVDRLIEVLTSGTAIRSTGAIPPALAGHATRDGYAYDPAGARRLLSQAGHPTGFRMEIWQRESPEGNRVLEAVQGYLSGIGVEVRLVRREWSAFKEAVSVGRVDAFFLDWVADYPESENFIYPLFHSANAGGGGNRSFFSDPEIDRLIEEALRTIDKTECDEMYERIDGAVYEQAPWIYLYYPLSFHAVSEKVSGYSMPAVYLGADYTPVVKRQIENSP